MRLCIVVIGLGALAGLSFADPPAREAPFQRQILQIAAEYTSWGRFDDEMRWAPWLCRSPEPGRAYVSASKDESSHGQKPYSLFIRRRDEYSRFAKAETASAGQVIVKQSWLPEEITDPKKQPEGRIDYTRVISKSGAAGRPFDHEADHFYPYVRKGDKVFKASKQADLFIMMKFDPKTPGTDLGWVYATTTPDGKQVTSAGKVESCMKCHVRAGKDRLFGPGKTAGQ